MAGAIAVLLGIATISGYLAWSVGTRATGLTMLRLQAEDLVSAGGLSLLFAIALLGGSCTLYAGLTVNHARPRLARAGMHALGSGFAATLAAATWSMLLGFGVVRSDDGYLAWLAIAALLTPLLAWGAGWASGTRPPLPTPLPWKSAPGRRWLVTSTAFCLLVSGPITGAALLPAVPASAGGLHPSPAIIHVDEPLGESETMGILAWVFRIQEGHVLFRDGCADPTTGRAFSIPLEDVHRIQWLTEATLTQSCQGRNST